MCSNIRVRGRGWIWFASGITTLKCENKEQHEAFEAYICTAHVAVAENVFAVCRSRLHTAAVEPGGGVGRGPAGRAGVVAEPAQQVAAVAARGAAGAGGEAAGGAAGPSAQVGHA